SANAPPLILISSTMPSKPTVPVAGASILKRFSKVNIPPAAGATMVGESNWVLPTLVGSGAKASFGGLLGLVVEVTQGTSTPEASLDHPAGSAGVTTPSKFS